MPEVCRREVVPMLCIVKALMVLFSSRIRVISLRMRSFSSCIALSFDGSVATGSVGAGRPAASWVAAGSGGAANSRGAAGWAVVLC